MAVTFRAYGASPGANSDSCVITKPTGLAEDDLMIAQVVGQSAFPTALGTFTAPANWTSIRQDASLVISTPVLASALFWKIADADDVAASDFTFTATNAASNRGTIIAWYGHDATTPINANEGQGNGGSTTVTSDGLTPTVADCVICLFCAIADNNTQSNYAIANDNPASWTEAYDLPSDLTYDLGLSLGYADRPETSATGNGTATTSGTANNTGQLVAIAPLATNVTVEPPTATSDGAGLAPTLSIGSNLLPPVATADAGGLAPEVGIAIIVEATLATCDAEGLVPTLSIGSNLLPPAGTADAEGLTPTLSLGVTIEAPLGTIDAEALIAVIGAGAGVEPPAATATAEGLTPTLSIGINLLPPTATAEAEGLTPTLGIGINLLPTPATATAEGLAPTLSLGVTISAACATADMAGIAARIITQLLRAISAANTRSIQNAGTTRTAQAADNLRNVNE